MNHETREVTHAARKQEPASDVERPRKKATAKPWRFRGKWLPSARWRKSTRVEGEWIETSYTKQEAREYGGFFMFLDGPPCPFGRYKRLEDALRSWDQAVIKGEHRKGSAEYWLENTDTGMKVDL